LAILDVLKQGARAEVSHVVDFATTPVGPFYTIDQMVATGRNTVRNVGTEAGIASPFKGQMRYRGQGVLGRIRGRLPGRFRRF